MRFRSMLPAIAALALLLPGAPTLAGTPPTATLTLEINGCEMVGQADLVTTDTLIVKHRSASGKVRAKHTITVAGGFWQVPCPAPRVQVGDTIAFIRQGSPTPFRVFTVPDLTIRTDRVGDRASGKAPGVSSVDVQLAVCDLASVGCTLQTIGGVAVAPGTNAWAVSSTLDLRGGSYARVAWVSGPNTVFRDQQFAQVVVRPGSALVTGFGRSVGRAEAVTQRRGDTFASGDPVTRSTAAFTTTLKRQGTERAVKAGDRITSSVAADATFTVPQTSLNTIPGGVEGTCAKNRDVSVLYKSLAGVLQFGYLRTTDANGHWEVLDAVEPDTIVEAWCATAAGDAIVRQIVER